MTGDHDHDGAEPPSRHRALAGLLMIVALIVAVIFIMHRLQQSARMQECFASGRTNCMPVETQGR